jgi:hypothetical protein
MTAKIYELKVVPDEDVLRAAEEFVLEVKSGNVVSFAVACELRRGATATQYATSPGHSWARLIGTVRDLEYRLLRKFNE